MSLLELEPVRTLLERVRRHRGPIAFDALRPVRLSRAPGRLDVMGGIADYTGSLVCEMPLGVGTAVALQEREDRDVWLSSYNLLDDHQSYFAGMSLDHLAKASVDELWWDFRKPGRKWAAYILGCLYLLHEKGHLDLADPRHRGLNLAVYSTIPIGGGVSSSAALEVATMVNLLAHFQVDLLRQPIKSGVGLAAAVNRWEWEGGALVRNAQRPDASPEPVQPADGALRLAALCQEVENRIVGAPCGIMDQVTCLLGRPGELLRLLCQPHELQPPLPLPEGTKVVGIFTGVRHDVAGDPYGRTRAAAFMGRRIIQDHMLRLAAEAGKRMVGDPTGGYLANLAPEDYKALFRPILPESMSGRDFLARYETHDDPATTISPDETYSVQAACDHHVLDAQRVRRFAGFIEDAVAASLDAGQHAKALRSAGKLMYASHRSYGEKAHLGHASADLLVDLAKQHASAGLHGARITGGGGGGTVAVLMEATERADSAVSAILAAYEGQTGRRPTLLDSTSPGAAHSAPVVA